MKTITKAFMVLTMLCLFSCSFFKKEDPADVVSDFMDAMAGPDFDKAGRYITRDSKTLLNLIQTIHSMGNELPAIYKKELAGDGKMIYTTISMENEKATVLVSMGKESNSIDLRKEDGKWKVVLDQDDLMDKMGSPGDQ